MIIGVTGTFASGKDAVGEYLKDKKGFELFTISDIIREEIIKRKIEPNRDNLRQIGNKLRAEHGGQYFIKTILARAKTNKVVIAGVRQKEEALFFKEHPNAWLVGVDAPTKLRFQRLKKRGRPGDPQTFSEFLKKEKQEMKGEGKNVQNIEFCIKQADFTIINDGSFAKLYRNTEKVLKKIQSQKRRKSK